MVVPKPHAELNHAAFQLKVRCHWTSAGWQWQSSLSKQFEAIMIAGLGSCELVGFQSFMMSHSVS